MGFFDFMGGNKTSSTSTSSSSQSAQKSSAEPQRTVEVSQESAAKPQAAPQQAKPAAPALETWRMLWTMSTTDKGKIDHFVTELIRHIMYIWHAVPNGGTDTRIKGRIGMHSDGKRLHIECRGYHPDIEQMLAWIRTDHYGAHVTYVEKYTLGSFPYSGLFQKKVGSW